MREGIIKSVLWGIVVSLVSIVSSQSFADQTVTTTSYTTEQIQSMNLAQIFDFGDEFNAHVVAIGNLMKRETDKDLDVSSILALGNFPIAEAQNTLQGLLRSELNKADGSQLVGMHPEIISVAIQVLEKIGVAKPDENLKDLQSLKELALQRVQGENAELIARTIDETIAIVSKRDTELVNLNDRIEEIKKEMADSGTRMEHIKEWMEKYYKGQPEIIKGLIDLEWRQALYGSARTKPDAIYMMGLPGTGKDTGAEVFTDALHGFLGAHSKHMFSLPLMKEKSETWEVFGSASGYKGSDNVAPFIAFLIEHSDGKYKIETKMDGKDKTFFIIENPEYRGQTLPGYFPPQSGIVYINEFHNWSKQLKDDVVKQALEKGIFPIKNPNGGVSEIRIPIRFILASNEGIGLLTSREANGQRHGKEMDFKQMLQKWENIHENKSALKNEILATNGERNSSRGAESTPGISEELINRIPDRFIFLLRPLSPDVLKDIATLGLNEVARKLSLKAGLLGDVELTWDQSLVDLIQEYDYVPEENARPILARIGTMVEDPILDAIQDKKLQAVDGGLKLELSVRHNPDNTRSLLINAVHPNGKTETVEQLIRQTIKDRPKAPISDERIDELAGMEESLRKVVFGIDPILKRLTEAFINIENETAGAYKRKANTVMLTGLSSTGKTETAVQLNRLVNGPDDELITFDFSSIQTLQKFQEKILGSTDGNGNPIPSEFMKHYDRNNGRIIVAFDELANVRDMDLLKSLYDFFDKPTVTTFSDNKSRPMGGVTIIVTGNAGQELYTQVPSDIPMEVQMSAWAEIYRRTENDPALQRRILEQTFPGPLLNRIGPPNIFFTPPHSYKSLRELAQLKLGQALERIGDTNGRRGWEVAFPDVEEYKLFIDTVIKEGFDLRAQGRSIESFIENVFEKPLRTLLLLNKIPSGSKAILKFRTKTANDDEEKPGHVYYDVYVDGSPAPLELKFRRPYVEKQMERNDVDRILTAYHEAGHSIVTQALNEDATEPYAVSIKPGVTMIGSEWVYYAGIAKTSHLKEVTHDRAWVIREIAVLAAGETAERLVSRGEKHTSGKQNDMARASRLARYAIIHGGLSEKWGTRGVPSNMTDEAYLASLSEPLRRLLEQEEQAFIKEGRNLAQQVLEANFENALIPMGTRLAENGIMEKAELTEFYKGLTLINPLKRSSIARGMDRLRTRFNKWKSPQTSAMNAELDPLVPLPSKIADIDEMVAKERQELYDQVALPDKLPVSTNLAFEKAMGKLEIEKSKASDCAASLMAKAG